MVVTPFPLTLTLSRVERELAILPPMFFRKPARKPHRFVRRLIAGLIIGGAIASIIGRKHREHTQGEEGEEKDE